MGKEKSEIQSLSCPSLKGLWEILHLYSTPFCHPLSPPSVLKLKSWNFPNKLLIVMPKKFLTRFFYFCLWAEIWSKWKLNLLFFFNRFHNIKARELIICLNQYLNITFNILYSKIKYKDNMGVFTQKVWHIFPRCKKCPST